MNFHLHKYKFECEASNGHKHNLSGYTENMLGFNAFHFHFFYGISSYRGHTHYYSGITGLPIKTANGHIHKMDGQLELNNLHEHEYNNFTTEEIEYISKRFSNEAFI